MIDLIASSKEIFQRAQIDYKPYAICLMLSGGDDSLTTLEVCNELGIKIDLIIHGVTGTGIKQTHDFVLNTVKNLPFKYVEANAGNAYEKYVLRKGFFGVGNRAHSYSYHLLKANPFRSIISKEIRHGLSGRPIILINGARRGESENRQKTMVFPFRRDPSAKQNIWVNLINEWPNHSTVDYLDGNNVERNPVSKVLCRSGECCCGTQQTLGDGNEAAALFPEWGKWWKDLRKAVKEKGFYWDWGQQMPKGIAMEKKGQINMFQPMCSDCKINYALRRTDK